MKLWERNDYLGSCADYFGCSDIESAATRPPTKWHNFNKISEATGVSPRTSRTLPKPWAPSLLSPPSSLPSAACQGVDHRLNKPLVCMARS